MQDRPGDGTEQGARGGADAAVADDEKARAPSVVGQDALGEIYVLTKQDGTIRKLGRVAA